MTPPIWFVRYCPDFNRLYDSWLLALADPDRQNEAAQLRDQMDQHKSDCNHCEREAKS